LALRSAIACGRCGFRRVAGARANGVFVTISASMPPAVKFDSVLPAARSAA